MVTPGQRADCTQFEPVLEKIRVPKPGPVRTRKKPDSLAADKAYSNAPCRQYLRRRGIRHTIPEKTDRQAARLRKASYRSTSTGTPRICSRAFRNSISDNVPTRPSWLSSPTSSRARDNEAAETSRKTFKAGTRLGAEPSNRSLTDPCAASRAARTSSGAGPGPACSHR
ncbi:transposase [Streptomyces sp. NPDC054849]